MPRRISLAIDIGHHLMRAAQVRPGGPGRPARVTATVFERLPEDLDREDAAGVGRRLAAAMDEAGMSRGLAVFALDRSITSFKRLDLPTTNPDELADMVRIAVERDLPIDSDEAVIDFTVIGRSETGTTVESVAVPRREVDRIREIAAAAGKWGPLSDRKVETLIDLAVDAHDPQARLWFCEAARGMDVQFGKPDDDGGTRSVWWRLFVTHAELIDRRLTAIARAVCDADHRSIGQRRAEAMGAVFAGADRIVCQCALPDCPNRDGAPLADSVVIHVVADRAAVDAAQAQILPAADQSPPAPPTSVQNPAPTRRALLTNGGVIPNPLLAQVIRDGAQIVSLTTPCEEAEARYRPSVTLQRFIRCRDLTCRFPGCDVPAEACDIDHAVAYPAGLTHPSNLRCLCRKHHLLRTFWIGDGGWIDRQLPDGTIIWTAPSGHTYTTCPCARMCFPDWCTRTGPLPPVGPGGPEAANRSLKMPRRHRTRQAGRAQRIKNRRAQNDYS